MDIDTSEDKPRFCRRGAKPGLKLAPVYLNRKEFFSFCIILLLVTY